MDQGDRVEARVLQGVPRVEVDHPSTFRYSPSTMSQDQLIILKNKDTGEVYYTRKNRKKVQRKIEIKKYSKKLRKHVLFKEVKK
jgi:large subunit ribosomal protein L33